MLHLWHTIGNKITMMARHTHQTKYVDIYFKLSILTLNLPACIHRCIGMRQLYARYGLAVRHKGQCIYVSQDPLSNH